MPNLKFREYRPGDTLKIKPKNGIFSDQVAVSERFESVIGNPEAAIGTITIHNEPVAVVGVLRVWTGVGTVVSFSSDEIRQAPIAYHKMILNLIDHHAKALGLHRVQMTVKETYEEGRRWAKALGFAQEGVLVQYAPDKENHVMYAKVIHG